MERSKDTSVSSRGRDSSDISTGVTSHGDVTEAAPGDKGVTYMQVRVINLTLTLDLTLSRGDVTEATPGDVTGSTSYHVTYFRHGKVVE